jgi:hypothetical protein
MLSPTMRAALMADLGLNALTAVTGPEHMLINLPAGVQFAALVTAAIVVEEVGSTIYNAVRAIHRWHRKRPCRKCPCRSKAVRS